MLRHGLCVIDVVERTAAVLGGTIALQFRQTPLVPELHCQTDDGAALFQEEGRYSGGINATGHGDGNEATLDFGALGKSVELGDRRHTHNQGTMHRAPTFSFYLASAMFR